MKRPSLPRADETPALLKPEKLLRLTVVLPPFGFVEPIFFLKMEQKQPQNRFVKI